MCHWYQTVRALNTHTASLLPKRTMSLWLHSVEVSPSYLCSPFSFLVPLSYLPLTLCCWHSVGHKCHPVPSIFNGMWDLSATSHFLFVAFQTYPDVWYLFWHDRLWFWDNAFKEQYIQDNHDDHHLHDDGHICPPENWLTWQQWTGSPGGLVPSLSKIKYHFSMFQKSS
jgi:hypothetical protein